MSFDLNQYQMIGRLTRDPEKKVTNEQNEMSIMGVACGEGKDKVSYFEVKAFGKTAEVANKYLSKGKQIAISGRIKQERWQTQEGNGRSKTVLIASNIQMLSKKDEDGQGFNGTPSQDNGNGGNQNHQPNQNNQGQHVNPSDDPFDSVDFSNDDEEIPF
jgi:single-strand DNA-binding protein